MTAGSASWIIENVNVVLEDQYVPGKVIIKNGLIEKIMTAEEKAAEQLPVVDGQGGWLLPGFIDVHVHGGYGADFMDANRQSFDTITRFHASHGTTGMLATTMTASKASIEAVLQEAAAYRAGEMPYAELLGVHLEGPFISEKWPGAQNPAHIADPQLDWLKQWTVEWPGLIRQLTLAPERSGALEMISWLAEHHIISACGHTDAVYDEIIAAADAGLSQAVHTYNAMRGLHHREPGTLGAVLTDHRITSELIADGLHVHAATVRLLLAAKPADKVILITDAMSAAGMPDGEYAIGDLPVVMKGGEARLKDGNALAGSCLTMSGALRYMLANTTLTVPEVSRLASGNAAKQLRIYDRTGSIAVGKQADLVLLDGQFHVQSTWVCGRSVYEKQS